MHFDGDEFVAGSLALDFVNTVGGDRRREPREKLEAYADLLEWIELSGALPKNWFAPLTARANGNASLTERVMKRVIAFREMLHAILEAVRANKKPPASAVEVVNRELSLAMAHARLFREKDHFTWTWDDSLPIDAPLWPIVRDASVLLTSDKLGRLKKCG